MNPRSFGQNVCRLRTEKKWTQQVLADRAGISRRHLQMIEAGQTVASILVADQLREVFNCKWEDLLG